MAGTDVEALRRSYEDLNRGDLAATLSVLHPDAVWDESPELPGGDTLTGRDAICEFLEGFLESWREFRQEIEEVVEIGERIALLIHLTAVGRVSGAQVDTRYAHVWTMRDGLGVRVEGYREMDAALRDLGAEARDAQAP